VNASWPLRRRDATEALLDAAEAITFADLPLRVVACARNALLDHLSVGIRGAAMPWSRSVAEIALADRSAPLAVLYGGGRVCARNAALANGTAAHALELDDTHDTSLTHPGGPVISSAFAIAQAGGASGGELLAAIVAGYEVQCRLGRALGKPLIRRGMHPTATLGVFGAAIAAGRLLRLDRRALRSAIGLAASMSAGSMQFSQDPEGTMVKRLFGGLPAERGLLAAQLAAAGITGPAGSLDGLFGVGATLAAVGAWTLPESAPGTYEIERLSYKRYPCCRNFHALIEAIAQCRDEGALDPAAITRVDVRGPRAMIQHHLETRPTSTMAAQYSLPYTTAVALLDDPVSPSSYDAPTYLRADLLALADKVVPHEDEALEAAFPEHFAGAVTVTLADGRTRSASVQDSGGTPAKPFGRAELADKFARITEDILDDAARARIAAAIDALDAATALDDLVAQFPLAPRVPGEKPGERGAD
jgi:2-methylcitrate dehydratase PrpD